MSDILTDEKFNKEFNNHGYFHLSLPMHKIVCDVTLEEFTREVCRRIWDQEQVKIKKLQKENSQQQKLIDDALEVIEFYSIHKNHLEDYSEEKYCEHGAFRIMGQKAREFLNSEEVKEYRGE